MKNTYFLLWAGLIVILTGACAKVPPAQQANYEGNIAYYSQRYDDALVNYQRSLNLADDIDDKQYVAIAMFGMARAAAQLCREKDADIWFKKSIAEREDLPDITHAYLTQNLLEYGRFLASWSRNSEAAVLYDRAMPMLETLGMEKTDPLGLAYVFDEYKAILRSVARVDDATARANTLRVTHKGKTAQFKPESYPKCSKEVQ